MCTDVLTPDVGISPQGGSDIESAMAFTLACPVFCGVYGVVDNWSGRSDVCKEVKFLSPSARIRRSRGNVYAGSQWNKHDEVKDYVA